MWSCETSGIFAHNSVHEQRTPTAMAPKKITVILDSDHRDSKKRIENQESFLFMLKNHAVVALLDNESVEINPSWMAARTHWVHPFSNSQMVSCVVAFVFLY